jgi:sugar phosphate isomerase/epimerase
LQRCLAIPEAVAQSADRWAVYTTEAAAAGFEAIEVPAGAPPEWISQASQRGLRPAVVRANVGLLGQRPSERGGWAEPVLDDMVLALELAAGAGGSVVTVRPAKAPPDGEELPAASYAEALWATYDALTALVGPAARTGVAVGVEPAADGFLLSPAELRDLLDRVNSPQVAACLDLGRIARVGRPLDWIGTLRHRIVCVRLDEAGESQVNEIAAGLGEVLYDGPVVCGGEPAEAARTLSRFGAS